VYVSLCKCKELTIGVSDLGGLRPTISCSSLFLLLKMLWSYCRLCRVRACKNPQAEYSASHLQSLPYTASVTMCSYACSRTRSAEQLDSCRHMKRYFLKFHHGTWARLVVCAHSRHRAVRREVLHTTRICPGAPVFPSTLKEPHSCGDNQVHSAAANESTSCQVSRAPARSPAEAMVLLRKPKLRTCKFALLV
jgi:hypothetical protein